MIVAFAVQGFFFKVAFFRLGAGVVSSPLLDEYILFSPSHPPFRLNDIVYLDYFYLHLAPHMCGGVSSPLYRWSWRLALAFDRNAYI